MEQKYFDIFRMTPTSFDNLMQYISSDATNTIGQWTTGPGRPPIPLKKQVLLTLWYMATHETLISIGSRFGVCETTAYRVRKNVLHYISNNIVKRLVQFPSADRLQDIERKFKDIRGISNVIGALDGTHIPIRPIGQYKECYFNRKSFYSLLTQLLFDAQLRILVLDVFTGYPGSVHDAKVFEKSPLSRLTKSPNSGILPD